MHNSTFIEQTPLLQFFLSISNIKNTIKNYENILGEKEKKHRESQEVRKTH